MRHLLLELLRLAPNGATVKVRVSAGDAAAAEIVVPDDSRSSSSPTSGRVEALLGKNRPAIELAQRIVALHGGSVLFAAGEGDLVATIKLPAG
ncbi:MAG: hypothetical protein A3J75_01185 [Acidobacteria bacterium RBG_16_68_9]|nr:MAG: hypothetical protein A3J75_01185 [Acidobacteria bacterium RBG_16_68_9]